MCPVCFANRWLTSHGKSQYTQHLPKPPCRHGGFWCLDEISPIFWCFGTWLFSHIIGNDNPNWLIFRRGWNHQPVFCCSNSQIVIFCLLEVQKMWQHGVMSCHSQMTHGPFETIATAVNTIGFSIGHRWCQEQKWRDTYEMREEQWFCRALLGVVGMCSRWYLFHIIPILICWGCCSCCSPGLCTTEGTVETHIVWFIVVINGNSRILNWRYCTI